MVKAVSLSPTNVPSDIGLREGLLRWILAAMQRFIGEDGPAGRPCTYTHWLCRMEKQERTEINVQMHSVSNAEILQNKQNYGEFLPRVSLF